MKSASRIFLCTSLMLASSFGTAQSQPLSKTVSAAQILQRMVKTYAECKSYSDSGVVAQHLSVMGQKMERKTDFKTAFVRPESLRFEYVGKDPYFSDRFIIWHSGKRTSTWSSLGGGVVQETSLEMAVAKGTGISSLSCNTIPALLFPVEVGKGTRSLKDMNELKRLKDEKINKVNCFCIAGQWAKLPTTLWIDAKSFAIRKIEIKGKFNQETVYNPSVNQPVSIEALKLNVPKTVTSTKP